MDNLTSEGRVQCQSCTAVIDVGIRLPDHNATEHDNAIEKESLGELLVDYGWLPTRGLLPTGRRGWSVDSPMPQLLQQQLWLDWLQLGRGRARFESLPRAAGDVRRTQRCLPHPQRVRLPTNQQSPTR